MLANACSSEVAVPHGLKFGDHLQNPIHVLAKSLRSCTIFSNLFLAVYRLHDLPLEVASSGLLDLLLSCYALPYIFLDMSIVSRSTAGISQ